jgi:hypothetical protein
MGKRKYASAGNSGPEGAPGGFDKAVAVNLRWVGR